MHCSAMCKDGLFMLHENDFVISLKSEARCEWFQISPKISLRVLKDKARNDCHEKFAANKTDDCNACMLLKNF